MPLLAPNRFCLDQVATSERASRTSKVTASAVVAAQIHGLSSLGLSCLAFSRTKLQSKSSVVKLNRALMALPSLVSAGMTAPSSLHARVSNKLLWLPNGLGVRGGGGPLPLASRPSKSCVLPSSAFLFGARP